MKSRLTRRLVVASLAALAVVAVGGTALAGHLTDGVKSYTGCLASSGGTLTLIKEGNAPLRTCPSGSTLAHFSGGDITKISVSGGLTGGGENGEVTIGLDPKYSLPQSCANAQVAKWNSATSAWTCAADDDTTYSAGTGLDLTGTTFSVEPDYRVKNTPDCTSGQFATGFDDSGVIQCAAPAQSSGIELWQKRGSAELPKGEGVDIITMALQPGTYLITAVATIRDAGGDFRDEEISVECVLRDGAFERLPAGAAEVDIGEETGHDGPAGNAVVHGAITFASADSVRFTCTSSEGDSEADQAFSATMTAIKVGTLHTP